jgi:hypothetical protein
MCERRGARGGLLVTIPAIGALRGHMFLWAKRA